MIIISQPATSSIWFSTFTRPTQSYNPLIVKMYWVNADSYQSGDQIVTASYDSYGFLNVTASLYMTASYLYNLTLVQMSGSTDCNELYRGEMQATTQSALVNNSDPFYSYTGATQEYIIYP
jgi:hypothetical protein